MVELRKINKDNYVECLNLHTTESNVDFVDPVAWSLAEAWVSYDDSRPFAIYADNVMVGYVSMYIGDNNPQIINFMIDNRFQKRGYGTAAARLCIEYLQKEYNASRISVPVHLEHISAQKFWSNIGFEISDTIENDYLFMRLYIPEKCV
ncbi:GNAT family N-acetyltransferase [Paenibacillus albiflavus]|uniref:GNAT family N-acetyltransferase n=1 Tax=Paenibacillus albiflavus TaxID=2545760 RepID=A0A4R4EJ97_9BACL|nr:GNAT family N-acetyltransferase [Paenibacillus albiflavus]TCZ72334.1 GNAT family N-acetyltransferase [Paenibacillus albiflavus]TCZ73015.1 GNAT family N-acetyltransferase [Paenibacillus albiflavus]TCZ79483.1 GNAT family N-acetyltransferase [Paenibacillus albiflavus]